MPMVEFTIVTPVLVTEAAVSGLQSKDVFFYRTSCKLTVLHKVSFDPYSKLMLLDAAKQHLML